MSETLLPPLPSLQDVHVLVVGDLMLDRYWSGPADRVSPEAPVPVLNVQDIDARAGGAANVALNVVTLGARCTLVGLVADDEAGEALRTIMQAAGVTCDFLSVEDWTTPVKLRLVAQQQQLMRADFETPPPLVGTSERLALFQNCVEKQLTDASVMVLADYDKGALEEPEPIIYAAQQLNVPVVVDPKGKPFARYRGANVLKPNDNEFRQALGSDANAADGAVTEAALELVSQLQLDGLVVTRGDQGLHVFAAGEVRHVPAQPVDVYDVTGAGDTTVAALAIAHALDWPLLDAARLANLAASIAVSKPGTAAVSGPELARAQRGTGGLIASDALLQEVALAKDSGARIVFTNGCFDLLHAGHVTYLEEAAALGDRLIVAINDDASVTRLKGAGRPIVPAGGRARVLLGLGCVDWVVTFSDDTPEALLKILAPDVLVKGGDYGVEEVVGAEIVREQGGEVRVLSLVKDVSTSDIVARIRAGDAST